MHSKYNEGKYVLPEKFIRTLKNKVFKHIIAISKNVCFDVLDDMGDSYAECNKDFNKKGPTFKIGDHVRISKYKNLFAKGYTPNWSDEVFVVSKIKNTVPWTYQ